MCIEVTVMYSLTIYRTHNVMCLLCYKNNENTVHVLEKETVHTKTKK